MCKEVEEEGEGEGEGEKVRRREGEGRGREVKRKRRRIEEDSTNTKCDSSAFRVIAAHQYLDTFSSDRTHMINKKDNSTWLSAPPTYPIIQNHGM